MSILKLPGFQKSSPLSAMKTSASRRCARADIVAGKVLVSRNFLGAVVKLGKTVGDGARWTGKQAGNRGEQPERAEGDSPRR
ncbi:MAG: hypothetical protein R3D02_05815 [Hyphomicrobiales bacterium]